MSKVDDILKRGGAAPAADEMDFDNFDESALDAAEQRNTEKEAAQTAEAADLQDEGDCDGCKI